MINKIILSCNEDPTYCEFWKPVSWAYKQMFPDVTVHLAFLTERAEDDALVKEYRRFGKVTLFRPVPGIPEFGQAKMIRFMLAAEQGDNVCYIDDIDLFPLSKEFITGKTDRRPAGHLLCVGGEVYQNNGCYPVSQMTGEGWLWKRFINPAELGSSKVLMTWYKDMDTLFDRRENICIETDFAKDNYFSDERFIRKMIHFNPVPKFELQRGYDHYLDATLDRAKWEVDLEKLKNHGYLNAHGIRPYEKNKEEYVPLINYIKENYPAEADYDNGLAKDDEDLADSFFWNG